jgi:putative MATE family efflux protein
VLSLAWPLVAERASFAILLAVDGILVGRYVGSDGLAAIGISSLMFWLPQALVIGMLTATTTVVGWDYGGRLFERLAETLRAAMAIAISWGVLVAVVLTAFCGPLLDIMGLSETAHDHGVTYMQRASMGMIGYAIFDTGAGVLRGMGNTRFALYIVLVVNALNACITFVLISGVVGVEMGMAAAGWGFGLSGLVGGGITLFVLSRGYRGVRWEATRALVFGYRSVKRLLGIAIPVAAEEAQFLLAFLVYVRIIATLGTDAVAAHAVAIRAVDLAIVPGFGLGAATTALVGQAMGAGRQDLAEKVATTSRKYAIAFAIGLAAVVMVIAPQIAGLFTADQAVVDKAARAMRVFAIGFPALGVYASLSGALRGAGDVKFVLLILTVTAWGVRIPAAFAGARLLELGLAGAWAGAVIEINTRAAFTWRRFASGGWKKRRV